MIIYIATNVVNKKVYIGQTVSTLEKRIQGHIKTALAGRGYKFHSAIRKYGIENFKWEVICFANNIDELNCLETKFILEYDSMRTGYNLRTGGGSGGCLSEEVKNKISRSKIGHKVSIETRKKISESLSGRKQSSELIAKRKASMDKVRKTPEYGQKISESLKLAYKNGHGPSKKGRESSFRGKSHTPESKLKMSIAQKNRYKNNPGLGTGREVTDETRKKMSTAAKQRWSDANERNKQSERIKNKAKLG